MSEQINYGTNNSKAWTDECPKNPGHKHDWKERKVGRCIYDCICVKCNAKASHDSSD